MMTTPNALLEEIEVYCTVRVSGGIPFCNVHLDLYSDFFIHGYGNDKEGNAWECFFPRKSIISITLNRGSCYAPSRISNAKMFELLRNKDLVIYTITKYPIFCRYLKEDEGLIEVNNEQGEVILINLENISTIQTKQ